LNSPATRTAPTSVPLSTPLQLGSILSMSQMSSVAAPVCTLAAGISSDATAAESSAGGLSVSGATLGAIVRSSANALVSKGAKER
jgi:hypothetical protein